MDRRIKRETKNRKIKKRLIESGDRKKEMG